MNIWYRVSDLDAARVFYTERLGFRELYFDQEDRWIRLERNGVEVAISDGEFQEGASDEEAVATALRAPAVSCKPESTRVFSSATDASRRSRAVASNFSALSFLDRRALASDVSEETSFWSPFRRTRGSSALAFLSLSVFLLSSALTALLRERRIKSSFESMTPSLSLVDSSVWPVGF